MFAELEELGIDRVFFMKELGLESRKVLMDEELRDQFLVMKAIIDKNMPKLLHTDTQIIYNIMSDVFPNIPITQLQAKGKIVDTIESRLLKKRFFTGQEFV